MSSLSKVVARNSAYGVIAQLLIKVLSFGFSLLIVRNLGAEAFGQYAGVLAFGAIFVFLADLGLSAYSVREVARWRAVPDGLARADALYGDLLALRFCLSVLAALLIIGSAWFVGKPPVFVLAVALGTLGLLMYSVQGTSEAILRGFERLDLTSGAQVVSQIIFVSVGALALWLGWGYYGLIGANLLGIAFMTWVCWQGAMRMGLRPRRPTPSEWTHLVRVSLPFGIVAFTLGLSYKFDSVLLTTFRSDVETGYYNAAYNLVFSAAIFSNALNTALYPSLSHRTADSSHSLNTVYERALRYLLVVGLPVALGVSILAEPIVTTLFRANYLPAATALQVVIWAVPFMYVSEFLGYVVLIANQEKYVARSIVISTSFNVLLNLLLVPRYGFMAAAVMTVLTEVVLVGQYVWLLRAELRRMNWSRTLWRPLLALALMGIMLLSLRDLLPWLVNGIISGLSYGVGLLILGVVGKDELQFVRRLRTREAQADATVVS